VRSITITKLPQTITFTPPTAMTMTSNNQPLVATSSAGSSYPVTFTTTSAACSINGTTLTVVSAGTCSITASQAGDATTAAASNVVKSITITKLAQTITFIQPLSVTKPPCLGCGLYFGLGATTSAGSTYELTFTSNSPSVCRVSGDQVYGKPNGYGAVTIDGSMNAGTCSITVSQGGDGNYSAAVSVTRTFNVIKNAQTITFTQPTAMTTTTADQALVATSSATGSYPVTLASTTLSTCTIVNGAIHVVSAGTCSITASQTGDGTYLPASSVTKSFAITQPQSTLNISNSNAANISKGSRGMTLATSGGSGSGAVSYNVTGTGCSYNANSRVLSVATTYQPTVEVSCSVTATKAANGTFQVATSLPKIFVFK
jgi:hypothetical protein